MSDIKVCEPGGKGLVLPLLESEQHWPNILRGILYALAMIYFFMGVAMIADTFMAAIESITSRRKKVLEHGKLLTKNVWNETVANLSLMALGSSAPEIALSVIELLRNNFYAGELGSSTIVGSAAFNLFVIVAVCIISIPDGETRVITGLPVFYVTAAFSVFAYAWLVLVLGISSPDIITIPEALATLLFLPLLIGVSYYADVSDIPSPMEAYKRFSAGTDEAPAEHKKKSGNQTKMLKEANKACHIRQTVNSRQGGSVAGAGVGSSALPGSRPPSQRGSQIGPVGGGRSSNREGPRRTALGRTSLGGAVRGSKAKETSKYDEIHIDSGGNDEDAKSHVQFLITRQGISGCLREKKVLLYRTGDLSYDLQVTYSVHLCDSHPSELDVHTAMQKYSYPNKPRAGREMYRDTAEFPKDDKFLEIDVQCPDKYDACFLVLLQSVQAETDEGEDSGANAVAAGSIRWTYVVKVPDATGELAWMKDSNIPMAGDYTFVPGSADGKEVQLVVMRQGGCVGEASCTYRTEKYTAVPGIDFEETDDVLEFAEGATERIVTVQVLGKAHDRVQDEFFVILQDGTGSIKFKETDDGGEDEGILTVQIGSLSDDWNLVKKLDRFINIDAIVQGNEEWKDQFPSAFFVGGDREAQAEASAQDWFWHVILFPWKLIFCFVPPTAYAGGWICFYTSLAFIGGTTAFVADLAELFGCVFNVPNMVTAITFVALGTSMPDLFASLSAASEDPTADAAIVNVTGSNSVNVFLGLGVPWTIASIYWTVAKGSLVEEWQGRFPDMLSKADGGAVFVVRSGDLAFSVMAFSVCCMAALFLLVMRRSKVSCELGGPRAPKIATGAAFIVLWFSYVALASWRAMRSGENVSTGEYVGVVVGVAAIATIMCCWPAILLFLHKPEEGAEEKPPAIADEEDEKKQDPHVADDTDGPTGTTAIAVKDPVLVGSPPTSKGTVTGQWKPVKETLSLDWDRLFKSIPSEGRALCTPDLERGRREMERAVAQEDQQSLVESRAHSADAVLKLIMDRLGLAEVTAAEVLKLLGLAHCDANASTSTLAFWFNRMAVLLAAGGEAEPLAQAIYNEAVHDNFWDQVARLVMAAKLQKWGAPPFIINEVSSEENDIRSLNWRILSQDGMDPVQSLHEVADCIQLDVYQDILRPILKTRLAIWGIYVENGHDLLEKIVAGAKTNHIKAFIARSILSDRTCLDDWIQLCDAINLDPAAVFLRPALQAYLQRVGFENQDSQSFLDRTLAMAKLNKVCTAIDRAVLGQMGAKIPSSAPCQTFGISFAPNVLKPILRASFLRIGVPEDFTAKLMQSLADKKADQVLSAFAKGFSKEVGFQLTDLNAVSTAVGVDCSTLCQSIIWNRLTSWGCFDSMVSNLMEGLKDMAVLESVSAEFSRSLLCNKRSVEDVKVICDAVGLDELSVVLEQMLQTVMTAWGLPADAANSLANKFAQTQVISESGEVLTRVFFQGSGAVQDLLSLCAAVDTNSAMLLTPLAYAGCMKCGLPTEEAQAIADKSAVAEGVVGSEALNNIVGAIISDKKPHVDDFMEICQELEIDFIPVMQQVVEAYFSSQGISEHDADSFSQRTNLEFVAELKEPLSAVIFNKEATVEHLRQLAGALCVDPLALVFRPILQTTFKRWGVPLQDTEVIANKIEDLQAVEDKYNRAVLASRPTAEAITELCVAIGVDAPSMVLRPALQGWLEQHGIRKSDAAGVAQKTLSAPKKDLVLLQNSVHMDSLNQLCAALDMDVAQELLRPVLQRHLSAWGFSASASAEVAAHATQIGMYRQGQRILTSVVLNDQGSVDDILELGSLVGIDPLLVLLKPIVKHSASRWGAAPNAVESLAVEVLKKDNLNSQRTLIAQSLLRSQVDLVAVERLLDMFGVTIEGGIQVTDTMLAVTPDGEGSSEIQDIPAKRSVKKAVRRKTREAATDGAAQEGENGEGSAVVKPKKSGKVKKTVKAKDSTAARDPSPSPSGLAADAPAGGPPGDDGAAVGAD